MTECPICLEILFNPVDTVCGHPICKRCHKSNKCPICRYVGMWRTNYYLNRITMNIPYKCHKCKETITHKLRNTHMIGDCNNCHSKDVSCKHICAIVLKSQPRRITHPVVHLKVPDYILNTATGERRAYETLPDIDGYETLPDSDGYETLPDSDGYETLPDRDETMQGPINMFFHVVIAVFAIYALKSKS